jgi:hypothetical protein
MEEEPAGTSEAGDEQVLHAYSFRWVSHSTTRSAYFFSISSTDCSLFLVAFSRSSLSNAAQLPQPVSPYLPLLSLVLPLPHPQQTFSLTLYLLLPSSSPLRHPPNSSPISTLPKPRILRR